GDYEDELKDDSDEELLEAGEEMDEEFLQSTNEETPHAHSTETPTEEPISIEHQSPSPNKDQPESSKDKKTYASDSESSSVVASYADLKWSIDDFHATTFKQYENTDAALRNYERILNRVRTDHVTGLNRILNNLQEVQTVVKEDPALKKKVLEAAEAYTKILKNLIELLTMVESSASMAWSVGPRMTRIENTQANIQSDLASLKTYTFEIKAMMTRYFVPLKDSPFLLPQAVPNEETPSQTKWEKDDMVIEEPVSKTAEVEKEPVQETQDTEPILISIVRSTITHTETEIIRSSSRPQLTDPIVEVQVSQPKSQSDTTPKPDRGKGIARYTNESPPKLVKASTKVCSDPDTPEKAAQEAKLLALSKPELIKVVTKVATKVGADPKTLQSSKGGQEFIKIQDPEIKVHNREHMEKLKKARELRKKMIKQYRWTTTSRRNPKTIIDILIHANIKPIAITIIPKKKNKVVGDLMTSLGKKYDRLKAQELEPEVRIPRLECNRSLPKGVQFVNNQVIEHPENGIFFIDVFSDEAFQRMIMRSLIDSHPDKEKLKSKRVKLEVVGYSLN
ncbi:hypothetical protein Tco_0237491, partial [Tanacetum coccineum]